MDKEGIRFYTHLFCVNSQEEEERDLPYCTSNFEEIIFLVRYFKKPAVETPRVKNIHQIK